MDQMLSPGFSIPSIGTPLHQMDPDQQIVANPVYHPPAQHDQQNGGGMHQGGGGMYGQDMNHHMASTSGQQMQHPTMPVAHKQMQSYQPSYQQSPMANGVAPHSMLQPQTPVSTGVS